MRRYGYTGAVIVVLGGMYATSRYNYLLFHALTELFSVAVAWGVFMLAWNARRTLEDSFLLFLGIAYLFVGSLDLLHTLAYRGMNVFPGYDANLPTQLWIAARAMESIALLCAPLLVGRRIRTGASLAGFIAVAALLLISIFGGMFPDCFIEGVGLTPFKKGSEYVISLILLASLWALYRRRSALDVHVYRLVAGSILLTVGAEIAFTAYLTPQGFPNLLGHFLKLGSFYLIYRALIETGLGRPYDVLFRELAQSKAKYQALFDHMPDGVVLTRTVTDHGGRAVDGVFLEANPAFERITGLDRRKVIGRRVTEVLPGIDRDPADWFGVLGTVALTGRPVRTENYADALGKWLAVSAYRPEPGIIATIFQDISERKRLERELTTHRDRLEELIADRTRDLWETNRNLRQEIRERQWAETELTKSEARYAKAAAIGRIGYWERDLDKDTGVWSTEACNIFGVDPAGRNSTLRGFLDLVHPHDRDTVADAVKATIANGGRLDVQYRIVRPDGELRHIQSLGEVVRGVNGAVSGLEGVMMDVTERRLTEIEMLHATRLASLGELAAGVAHEVNNPVNGIINYAQVLLDQVAEDDGEKRKVLGLVIKEGERISQIVRSLLRYSRQEPEEKELVHISEVVADLLPLVEGRLRKAGIELRVDVAPDLVPVMGKAQLIHQVLLNAVSNARYALERCGDRPRDGKFVHVCVGPVEKKEGTFIRTTVLDNGPGIPEDILHRVMDPFFTTKPASEGTGLGLSISYGIVADHGGDLRIDSVEGEYTELVMDLPAAPSPFGRVNQGADPVVAG